MCKNLRLTNTEPFNTFYIALIARYIVTEIQPDTAAVRHLLGKQLFTRYPAYVASISARVFDATKSLISVFHDATPMSDEIV